METEVRFSGFGGQGVILMGIVLARAAALYDFKPDSRAPRKNAIQTQSYGPSARGGHSKCDIKISSGDMLYPFVEIPDYLVIMSQQAFDKYALEVKPETKIIIDPDLVRGRPSGDVYMVSSTKAAEGLGTRIVANVIMLAAFREISEIVTFDALEKATLDAVPPQTHDLNKSALKIGRKLGLDAMEAKDKD